jgi:hypothetical protein
MPGAIFIYNILKGTRTVWLANLIIKFMSPGVILGVKVSLLSPRDGCKQSVPVEICPGKQPELIIQYKPETKV